MTSLSEPHSFGEVWSLLESHSHYLHPFRLHVSSDTLLPPLHITITATMADTQIKPEIKLDPSTSTPPTMSNVEDFEDDTDLHIPPPDSSQAWLVKLPGYLWQAWNEIYAQTADAEPIEIGKMRVYNAKEGEDPLQQKIQIRLNAGVPQHVDLPKNYEVDLKSQGYNNTVVFSEKDLPGHQHARGRKSQLSVNRGIQSKSDRYSQQQIVKPGHYRTAIPKQTALAPLIHHEADARPVEDASYMAHFKKSYQASINPKKQTTFQHGIDRSMHPGSSALSTFSSFGLTSRPSGRKAPPKEKAVRISQGELLDHIYKCFRRYRYWSLKALKNELRQPENFIKQTLESIAILVRSGDFAMNYKLKDEYESIANVKPEEVKEETAVIKSEDEGSLAEDGEMEGDEDDEGDEFEDVNMEGGDGI